MPKFTGFLRSVFGREINNLTKHSFGDIFLYIWSSKKNLCDMQQRIISPLKYLICVQDSVCNFYMKQKILQIVIFRIVSFYLNQQNPEKNEKFEIFASFNKKSDFWAKKNCFNYLPNTFKYFFAQSLLVHGQKKAKLKIMPLEWSRYLM